MSRWMPCLLSLLFALSALPARSEEVPNLKARVVDSASGLGLAGVHWRVESLPGHQTLLEGDATPEGAIDIPGTLPRPFLLRASRLGYLAWSGVIAAEASRELLEIRIQAQAIPTPGVDVTPTRASERASAVAFTTLDRARIQERTWAQDVPMLLAETPGVFAYSDAGNGVGYSYVRLRGFPQRRVAVTLNGIPLNDPESHEVYWVDQPDFLTSTQEIQVQRGAGSAAYGAGAVGGSINLETPLTPGERGFTVSSGYGSYRTRRSAVEFRSGLVDDRYGITARYSRILSDGYRDQSWARMWSWFLSGFYRTGALRSRLNLYGGPEELHLAYYAVDRATLDGGITGDAGRDRRSNPLSWPGETDHFYEPHAELIQSVALSERATATSSLFFFTGEGYYNDFPYGPQSFASRGLPDFAVDSDSLYPADYYEVDAQGRPVRGTDGHFHLVASDMTQRLNVANHHFGWIPRVRLQHAHGELTLGGEWRAHEGRHWGELTWSQALPPGTSPDAVFYDYVGVVHTASVFAQEAWDASEAVKVSASLQLRHVRQGVTRDRVNGYDFRVSNIFVQPRLGANWNLSPRWNAFASYAHMQAEPILSELYPADDRSSVPRFAEVDVARGIYRDPLIRPESLHDFEAGAGFSGERGRGKVTLYWMEFRDEIVPDGQIDRFGVPITGNAASSYHRGLEAEGRWQVGSGFELGGNVSLSRNRFRTHREFVDSTTVLNRDGNAIALFPDHLANLECAWRHRGSRVAVSLAAAGTQYLDNSEDHRKDPEARQAAGYVPLKIGAQATWNATASLALEDLVGLHGVSLDLRVMNLADRDVLLSGYTYADQPYFYPAARRNFFASVRWAL